MKEESFAVRAGNKMDETVRTFFAAALIALVIRAFAFEPFNIPSSSMVPGLLIGDFLFVSKYVYGYSSRSAFFGLAPFDGRVLAGEPERGDVVVFKLPSDNSTDYIKRLVGLPGDNIQVKSGLLYVNGVAVERRKLAIPVAAEYLKPKSGSSDYIETFPEGRDHVIREDGDDYVHDDTSVFTVPAGHYFFMGDNRDNSQDSRTNMVGFVPAENLVGRAEVIFFSLGEDARFWQFWKWPTEVRWNRIFKKIE